MKVTKSTIRKALNEAADLIERAGHAKGNYAVNSNGFPTDVGSPDAVCYCAFGALLAVSDMTVTDKACDVAEAQLKSEGIPYYLVSFNDFPETTKEDVVSLLRRSALSIEEEL